MCEVSDQSYASIWNITQDYFKADQAKKHKGHVQSSRVSIYMLGNEKILRRQVVFFIPSQVSMS